MLIGPSLSIYSAGLRPSNIVPYPITLTPSVWLDASQLTGLNDGDPVTLFQDKSGNGFDFGGVTNRTIYVRSGLNGLPTVRDIGTGDGMLAAPGPMSSIITRSTFTVCLVARVTSAPSNNEPAYLAAALLADGQGDAMFALAVHSDSTVEAYAYDGAPRESAVSATVGTFYTFTMVHDAGELSLRVNDDAPISVACGDIQSLDFTAHLFSNYSGGIGMEGDIAELVVCKTAPDTTALRSYLRSKWGHY